MSDGGGSGAVLGYRKLQSHHNSMQCMSFNWILESGKPPAIKDFFFSDIYVQFRYCTHVKFLGYGNGIMIMKENDSVFRREMLKYQIIYDAAIYFQVVQQEKNMYMYMHLYVHIHIYICKCKGLKEETSLAYFQM